MASPEPTASPGPGFTCSHESGPTPLLQAVTKADVAITRILADLCPEHLNTEYESAFRLYETPLSLAVKAQAIEIVRILVEAGADPTTISQNAFRLYETPLSLAVKAQAIEIVRILVEAGADPNLELTQGFLIELSPLEMAIERGYTTIVEILTGSSS